MRGKTSKINKSNEKEKILLETETLNNMCRQGNIEMSLDLYWTGVIAVYDPHEIQ